MIIKLLLLSLLLSLPLSVIMIQRNIIIIMITIRQKNSKLFFIVIDFISEFRMEKEILNGKYYLNFFISINMYILCMF